ncbi:putative sporulation protein YtaF [Thermoanaerobacter thermohydrosulfuricus]|jgi:putative sporulation protein YtaF|uniref:Putative sporulation protein YtaF n=3 Tax=Thermoanaerobacter TaxID=1754 RepID=I8R2S8_9THEO|nr:MULTISPECIES: sporulation membrane protein YtaF [Thermoanaerobacter]EIV99694.1 putative sporulation protein YtaF [Thermoanaerobacter siderophilus SR4]EMT38263.1 putative sporulation protein YtaF [Thermoanaerobacter thermohydrosulfuricus WC1]SDF68961.1 putative sporulation protein YtaF [Thermoanaerobacter thermohydrosulfuricus]SFE12109.1 putative sporulation protein YtaF [Thermoanaerobacter thermohydrosulfuricus]
MEWLIILGFAISASIDNFGVGISYGIRNIRISLFSNTIIAVISFLFSISGILFGKWLNKILPGSLPGIVGAFLLFIIGLRIILLAVPRKSSSQNTQQVSSKTTSIKGILENPEIVDLDKSGEISLLEAILLGIALSANALTNGLGAGLLGFSPFAISFTTAIGSLVSVWAGVQFGTKVANIRIGSFTIGQFGTIISGVILLIIAYKALF